MGELALRYPPRSLIVSTGRHQGSEASDPRFPQQIDHVGIRATRLRTLNGLALWTARAGTLASDWYYLGRVRPFDELQSAIQSLTPESIVGHLRNRF